MVSPPALPLADQQRHRGAVHAARHRHRNRRACWGRAQQDRNRMRRRCATEAPDAASPSTSAAYWRGPAKNACWPARSASRPWVRTCDARCPLEQRRRWKPRSRQSSAITAPPHPRHRIEGCWFGRGSTRPLMRPEMRPSTCFRSGRAARRGVRIGPRIAAAIRPRRQSHRSRTFSVPAAAPALVAPERDAPAGSLRTYSRPRPSARIVCAAHAVLVGPSA